MQVRDTGAILLLRTPEALMAVDDRIVARVPGTATNNERKKAVVRWLTRAAYVLCVFVLPIESNRACRRQRCRGVRRVSLLAAAQRAARRDGARIARAQRQRRRRRRTFRFDANVVFCLLPVRRCNENHFVEQRRIRSELARRGVRDSCIEGLIAQITHECGGAFIC